MVFDGWGSPHLESKQMSQQEITVVFTKRGETADEWIKRRVGEVREGAVVTSDREIQGYAEQAGVPSISSQEFERKMEEAIYFDLKGIELNDEGPVINIKKGPARQLSKKEKRRHALWKKL